jgi:hypothetical protein
MRFARIVAIVMIVYLAIGLCADTAIGFFQPQSSRTAVLRTFDADGGSKDTVLALLDDNGQLWVESGHWFRGWYKRLLANPDVELTHGGTTAPYRAVPVDDPATVDHITHLMGKGTNARYWVARAMLLWAPIKPVRLDPLAENAPAPSTP